MNRKSLWASCLLIAGFSVLAVAGDKMSVEERLTQLEKEMQEVSVTTREGQLTASFARGKANDQEWYAEVGPLLWHAKGGGLDWVLQFNQANLPHQGRMKYMDFGWDWGVRVGLGHYFERDGWDLGATYTYFQTNDSQHVYTDFLTYDEITESNASGRTRGGFSGRVTLNEVDVLLGKDYFISHYVSLHPTVGIEAVWLDQKYKLSTSNYINALQTSIPVEGTLDSHSHERTKVFGIGPRLGIDANIFFYNHFKMLGAASLGLLQGYYKVTEYQDFAINPTNSEPVLTDIDLKGNMHRLFPHGRMLLGLAWSDMLKNGKYRLEVSGAYEVNYFWRANQDLDEMNSSPSIPVFSAPFRLIMKRLSEDMAFYGVTFKIKLDF